MPSRRQLYLLWHDWSVRIAMRLSWGREAVRATVAAGALVYFVIGKIAFEPRLAFGFISVNQILQLAVLGGLLVLPWCGDLGRMVRSRTLWLVGALALLLAVRAIGADNSAYAPAKPLGYLGLVVPALTIFAASLHGRDDVRRLLLFWALVGTAMMLLGVLLLLGGASPPRLAVFGGGSNGYARMLGTALLLWIGLDTRWGKRRVPVWLLALPVFAVTLLFAGSKTAILGLGISIAALALHRGNRRLLLGAMAGTLLFATAPLWTHGIAHYADKNRGEVRMFIAPDIADPQGSYGTRLLFYRRSLEFLKHPSWFGVGTGDWHAVVGLPSGRRHPHNIELEVACELGMVGLALFLGMLAVAGRWILHRGADADEPRLAGALIAVLVFWLFNAQLNGDLLDNRWIWLTVLLLEIVVAPRRQPAEAAVPREARLQSA